RSRTGSGPAERRSRRERGHVDARARDRKNRGDARSVGAMSESDVRRQARFQFDSGDHAEALRLARDGLDQTPDDVELLVLAGRAAVERDEPDATGLLQRATELSPADASAWHHLGEALATDGHMEQAEAAFRRAVELNPTDQVALSNLGHTALA